MQENIDERGATPSKFARQAADMGAVYLYKEGLFVRAYNEGAFGFIHHVLACKPMRRFVKSAGEDRIVCGVPFTVLAQLPGFAQAEQFDALTWRWPLENALDGTLYAAWREGLPLMPNRSLPVNIPGYLVGAALAAKAFAAEAAPTACIGADRVLAQRLLDQLTRFNVATSTPVAALNLVADLQRQWRESEVG